MEKLTKEQVVEYLKNAYSEESLNSAVDEYKPDFLNEDWEDEYGDEEEAYRETGRGEAEAAVVTDLTNDIFRKFYPEDATDTHEAKTLVHNKYKEEVGEDVWETIHEVYTFLNVD